MEGVILVCLVAERPCCVFLGDWRNWERSSFASFSQEFDSPILHQYQEV